MTIWYIGPSGSDTTGNGTSGSPYATVAKCITVGANGDTVKALTGTYTISSTTNITKQITVTSNSGVKTDVIFNSNTTVFNVQSNNVSITYVTLQTSSASALVTIDRMSTGTTVPTFWTGITINNCNIKYVTNALELNGTFTVTSNAFTRMSGSNVATIIKVYSTRGACSISSNTFTDSQPVQYLIQNTSSGSGTYLDMCNSKGGTSTIASNTITFTHASQITIFLFHDYFNQYNYVTSPSVNYNPNTKLSLLINNNNISYAVNSKSIVINTVSSTDYNMFDICNINTNNVSYTDYGILHLEKNVSVASKFTISNTDLSRSIFKLYSNTLNTYTPPTYLLQFDASNSTTIFTDTAGTIQAVNINDPVRLLKSTTNGQSISTTLVNTTDPPYLMSFTTGTKCIKFNNNSSYYSFNNTSIFSGISNATLVIVEYCPSSFMTDGSGHLFNMGYGWYPYSSYLIWETFYTNSDSDNVRTSYTGTSNSFSNTLIYAVVADSSTGRTKCYSLNINNSSLNLLADLVYNAGRVTNPVNGKYTIGSQQGSPTNKSGLAELNIISSALSESALLQHMLYLKTKWGIT